MPSVFNIDFRQVNTNRKGYVKWKIYVFFIFNLLVPLFRPSEWCFFFYISIYRGYYALPCNDFKGNIQMQKPIFKMPKSVTRSNILNGK